MGGITSLLLSSWPNNYGVIFVTSPQLNTAAASTMNPDAIGRILALIDYPTYAAVYLVCHQWRAVAVRIHGRGAALSPILRLIEAFPRGKHDWYAVSKSPRVPFWYIMEHPGFDWPPYAVSKRRDLTPDRILVNSHFKWDWHGIIVNEALPLEFVITLPAAASFSFYVSKRNDVTEEFVAAHPHFPWKYNNMIDRLSIDFVIGHPNIEWDLYQLANRFT